MSTRIKNLITLLVASLIALFLGELLLQLFWVDHQKETYFWQPHLHKTLYPDSTILPGISGISEFQTNSIGLRADEFPSKDHQRIVAIGGSTTECFYLDQQEAWPALLQQELSQQMEQTYWVGNMGKSGLHSGHHLIQLDYLLNHATLDSIDLIIMMVGINDLNFFLANPDQYLTASDAELRAKIFSVSPQHELPFYKKSGYWQLLRQIKNNLLYANVVQDDGGKSYQNWRSYRQQASQLSDSIPNLELGLRHYESNIKKLIAKAKAAETLILFLSQPTLWKANMPAHEQELLWMGGVGKYQLGCCHEYYTTEALSDAMQQFNQLLLKHSKYDSQVGFLDIAGILPKDTTVFVDDCHFNEHGARQVNKEIGKYFNLLLLYKSLDQHD